jgi:hypothetical protein
MGITIAELNKRIRRDNKAFAKMTPAQKRVAIAKDVIKHLNTKKLTARAGTYLISYDMDFGDNGRRQVSTALKKVEDCEVCAIGAAFLCSVKKLNSVTASELFGADAVERLHLDDDPMRRYLKATGAFTSNQLTVIERVFEGWQEYYGFNKGVIEDDERLRRTMQFIIDNNGSVKFPKDEPRPQPSPAPVQ